MKTIIELGDREEAAAKLGAIMGEYRHSFENGDVEGEKYRSTNVLSRFDSHYELALEFYNGHTCEREGNAR
ncbi:hypothetical protein [Occallatibacter riparius]|uniref:Uncharacterized protein n=1 Tax=Occallatibacter riparius TaxID=1002689 RepID=A0A9J7BUY5_9BACT|nr:hypothetical protein [Occallatibacter riparius]UWZ86377.1 hypothetical protein MOP44_10635 [Occallatibacter riparius]